MSNTKKRAIIHVLKDALRRETKAFNFYIKSSQKAPYSETESLLIQLAEEERKHRHFLIKEIQRIDELLTPGTEGDYVKDREVRYSVPDEIVFKKLQTIPGVDLAAVTLPTELLGGDYLDLMNIERERETPSLGIFLYDVMGHGLEATHLKALAKKAFGELRELWLKDKKTVDLNYPSQVIAYMNRKLVGDCQASGRFITALYGIVDPVAKTFIYTSAGHEPPILIKSDGEYVHLNQTQLLLGADHDLMYENVVVPIGIGDVLVLYSDGIVEARNSRGKMFERERLHQAVEQVSGASAREIIRNIFQSLRKYLNGKPVTDDFTLAVLKIVG